MELHVLGSARDCTVVAVVVVVLVLVLVVVVVVVVAVTVVVVVVVRSGQRPWRHDPKKVIGRARQSGLTLHVLGSARTAASSIIAC